MKILILKPSSLGDVVQALPVLRLLKKHLPESEIYWWIESRLAPLLVGDPDLAGLVLFDRRRWAQPQNWGEVLQSVRWVREKSFDWVIDLQSLFRSGAFAWLANGALTVGLDDAREGARGLYDFAVRRASFHTHAVDWYLEVLRFLDVPVHWNFTWLPKRPQIAETIRPKNTSPNCRWVVIQPGARWTNKRWPIEYFGDLAERLVKSSPHIHCAILGGSEDRPLGAEIARVAPERCLDLTGALSLPEMVEWIRLADLMVSNDTGPMHVAAALAKPVVALFGPTEPSRTGPYRQLENVLRLDLPCSPCLTSRCRYVKQFECLRALTPETVFASVQSRLSL